MKRTILIVLVLASAALPFLAQGAEQQVSGREVIVTTPEPAEVEVGEMPAETLPPDEAVKPVVEPEVRPLDKGIIEAIPKPLDVGSLLCKLPLKIEVVQNNFISMPTASGNIGLVLLDRDVGPIKFKATGGTGKLKWTVESKVEDSCHEEWVNTTCPKQAYHMPPHSKSALPEIGYLFYNDYRCEKEKLYDKTGEDLCASIDDKGLHVADRFKGWTRNPTWQCIGCQGLDIGDINYTKFSPADSGEDGSGNMTLPELMKKAREAKAPSIFKFETDGDELTLKGRIRYDGPLPVSKLVDEKGRDNLDEDPVEELYVTVTDECHDYRPEGQKYGYAKLKLKIRYPDMEPLRNLKMDVVYGKKRHEKRQQENDTTSYKQDQILFKFKDTHEREPVIAELKMLLAPLPDECPDGYNGYCAFEASLDGLEGDEKIFFDEIDELDYLSKFNSFMRPYDSFLDESGKYAGSISLNDAGYRTNYWYADFDEGDQRLISGYHHGGRNFSREDGEDFNGFQNNKKGFFRRRPWPAYRPYLGNVDLEVSF